MLYSTWILNFTVPKIVYISQCLNNNEVIKYIFNFENYNKKS